MLTLRGRALSKRGLSTYERFVLLPEGSDLIPGIEYVLLVSDDMKQIIRAHFWSAFNKD